MTASIDVKTEPRGAYRIVVRDEDGNSINTFGDFDVEVVKSYMGKPLADHTRDIVEIADRMPEGSAVNVSEGLTEVFAREKLTASFPVGLGDFPTTILVLDRVVRKPDKDAILDLRR